jgi:hypothetical protein
MQRQTSIYIPKPCHEDWNKMTPTQQGKFCASCNKQVIDFSLMRDPQILNFLSQQSGKLCGRFDAEQLERPLIETKIKKKKSWWMALTMPLLFLFDRSEAQDNKIVGDTIYNASYRIDTGRVVGLIAKIIPDKKNIKGKVLDANNNPIAYATIMQKGTKHGAVSDASGNFSIDINNEEDSVTLVASFVGFKPVEKQINILENNAIIKMAQQDAMLSDVVVIGKTPFYGRLGGAVAICTRITTFEKIDSSFRKAIGISNVYPNPVMRGNSIHLKIKNAGNYQMQLLDNQSRLIQAEEINIANNTTKQIQLSSNIAAGIYYLRLINEQTKKSYTEKVIVQ